MNLFKKIFRELEEHKVKYLVIGGVAVNLYGYLRFTKDLDILVISENKNLKNLDIVMKKLDNSPLKIDINFEEEFKFNNFFKNKTLIATNKILIPVSSIDDLIQMKTNTENKQDQIDIEALLFLKGLIRRVTKKLHTQNIDIEQIKHWKDCSPESKLQWIYDAWVFGKAEKTIVK